MFQMPASALRGALGSGLIVAALALGAGGAHAAASDPNALGQAWPQAQDASLVPGWHVYAFSRDGVKYLQINDAAGKVRAAIATANGQFLVLPMGSDAQRVVTPQQPQPASNTAAWAVTLYRDAAITVTAASSDNGTTVFRAAAADNKNASAIQAESLQRQQPQSCGPCGGQAQLSRDASDPE